MPLSADLVLTLVVAGLVRIHLLDDNFLQPELGTTAGDRLVSGLVPLAVLAMTATVAVRARPGAQTVATGIIGTCAIVAGLEGWQSLWRGSPSHDDFTGILALPAGAVLLAWSGVRLWRTRRRGPRRMHRHLRRGLIAMAGLLLALPVGYPMATAYVGTLSSPVPSAADVGLQYQARSATPPSAATSTATAPR